jgi:hypothetical protein
MVLRKKPYKPSYAIFLKDYHNNSASCEWDPFLAGHHTH